MQRHHSRYDVDLLLIEYFDHGDGTRDIIGKMINAHDSVEVVKQ